MIGWNRQLVNIGLSKQKSNIFKGEFRYSQNILIDRKRSCKTYVVHLEIFKIGSKKDINIYFLYG